ncbi:MAG: hypothetical protein ACRDL7_08210, partial [Gaiellaceae bacterium]
MEATPTTRISFVGGGRTVQMCAHRTSTKINDTAKQLISDSGANISVLGANWEPVEKSVRTIDIVGFADDLDKKDLPIVNAVTKTILPSGHAILLQVNEAAYMGIGDLLLSKIQVGSYGLQIDDDPHFGSGYLLSKEQIGVDIPLQLNNGMVFIEIYHPSECDLELPTLILTSDFPWNPNDIPIPHGFGSVVHGTPKIKSEEFIKELAPKLGTTNLDIVHRTIENTTWMGRLDPRLPLCRHIKPRIQHMGLVRLQEDVAMDTLYPARDSKQDGTKDKVMDYYGNTCVQVFVGFHSQYVFAVLLKQEHDGPGALKDFIRYVGCPQRLHYDRSKMHLSKKVKNICRDAYIPQTT